LPTLTVACRGVPDGFAEKLRFKFADPIPLGFAKVSQLAPEVTLAVQLKVETVVVNCTCAVPAAGGTVSAAGVNTREKGTPPTKIVVDAEAVAKSPGVSSETALPNAVNGVPSANPGPTST